VEKTGTRAPDMRLGAFIDGIKNTNLTYRIFGIELPYHDVKNKFVMFKAFNPKSETTNSLV